MKKRLTLAAALFFISSALLFGQDTFTKTYGLPPSYEGLEDIIEADGRYYGLGSKYSNVDDNLDMYLVALSPEGELIGEFTYNVADTKTETGQRIIPLSDGLLLLGEVKDYASFQADILAVKVGFDGQLIWTKLYGAPSLEETFGDAAQSENGDILLVGTQGYAPRSLYYLKINAAGDLLSEVVDPEAGAGTNQVLISNREGGWYVSFFLGGIDYVAKLDNGLQEEWRISEIDLPVSNFPGSVYALVELTDGNLRSVNYNFNEISIITLTPDGSFLLESIIQNDDLSGFYPRDAALLDNGHILIGLRRSADYVSGSYLLEIDINGEEQNRYNLADNIGQLNQVLPVGASYLLAGATLEEQGGFDAKVVALSPTYETQWDVITGEAGRYGQEIGYSLIEGEDGSYYILGVETLRPDETDITLTRINADGNILWQSYFGTDSLDRAYSLVQTADGHIAIFGYRTLGNNLEIVIYKVDDSGNLIWETRYAPQAPIQGFKGGIVALPDGGIIAGCHTFNNEALLLRLSSDGAITWVRQEVPEIPGLDGEVVSFRCFEITLSNDGDILLSGGAFLTEGGYGALTQKYRSSDGSPIWSSFLRRESVIRPYSLATLEDGSIYGLGWQIENGNFSRILYKLSSTGDSIWFKSEPADIIEYRTNYSISPAPGQQLLVVNSIEKAAPENSFENEQLKGRATLFDDMGEEIWRREFSPAFYTLLYDGTATTDGGFALIGLIDNYQPSDMYFIKMAGDGTVTTQVPIRPELQLRLFPNPADEVMYFEVNGEARGTLQAVLYDAQGKPLRAWQCEKTGKILTESLDVRQLPAGAYFLSLVVDGVRYGRQWVKR